MKDDIRNVIVIVSLLIMSFLYNKKLDKKRDLILKSDFEKKYARVILISGGV